MELLKPLLQLVKCDRCGEVRQVAYIPDFDEWLCAECLEAFLTLCLTEQGACA